MTRIILAALLFSNFAFADCDFSKDIKPLATGHYDYSADCHLKVGQLVQDNATKDKQLGLLNQSITLKDLAITKSDERVDLWQRQTFTLEDRIQKVDDLSKRNQWLWFILGALTVSAAGITAAQLSHR